MKTLIFILSSIIVASCSQPKELENASADSGISRIINDREYAFVARTVLPTGGRIVQLTSLYDMRVSKDSIIAYLPYFGRAYTAPIGATNGGIQFTSTDFGYNAKKRRKGGWQISIRPKDLQDIQQVNMTVSEAGAASLQVISNNRQPISYNGVIEAR